MVSRRNFFGSAFAAGLVGLPDAGCASTNCATGGKIVEPARELNVAGEADVIVAGGGPAGISAAIGAARQGAKVILIESKGTVGGHMDKRPLGMPHRLQLLSVRP